MKFLVKLIFMPLGIFVIGVVIVWLADPARLNQVLGDWGRKFGYYSFAIERYSQAIHLNANIPGAFNSRGVTLYVQGQVQLAVQDYDRALQLDPQYALAIKNRALAFLALSKPEEAKRDYIAACKLGRCEDFSRRCPEFKDLCKTTGECTIIQSATTVGLCTQ